MSAAPLAEYSVTIQIPVADHVYKYLKTRCGSAHIVATRTDFFGSLVLSYLGRNPDLRKEKKKTDFTRVFQATIAEDSYTRLGLFISPTSAQLFNDQVDKMFREELFFHLMINSDLNHRKFLASMRRFLEVYDITESDIKLDSLYRDFKRRKDKYESENLAV